MPKNCKLRNKAIVQLLRLGWAKCAVARVFHKLGYAKTSIYLVMKRDWDKYQLPTSEELKQISDAYKINIGALSNQGREIETPKNEQEQTKV